MTPDPIRAALEAIYEWYDRDGSVGGASNVFEDNRHVLATTTTVSLDEAAIRADERERCAKLFHQAKDIWTGEAAAAAIRAGGE